MMSKKKGTAKPQTVAMTEGVAVDKEVNAKIKRADKTEPMCELVTSVDFSHGECGRFYKGVSHTIPTRCANQLQSDFPEVVESIKELKVTASPETK